MSQSVSQSLLSYFYGNCNCGCDYVECFILVGLVGSQVGGYGNRRVDG